MLWFLWYSLPVLSYSWVSFHFHIHTWERTCDACLSEGVTHFLVVRTEYWTPASWRRRSLFDSQFQTAPSTVSWLQGGTASRKGPAEGSRPAHGSQPSAGAKGEASDRNTPIQVGLPWLPPNHPFSCGFIDGLAHRWYVYPLTMQSPPESLITDHVRL